MSCLELAHRNGHWVILNNIHLMPSWLIELEKKLDEFAIEGSHEKFRLYLSSDPSNAIPIGVLSRCIKLTNEPPAGLKANLKRAFANFSRDYIEEVGTVIYSRQTVHVFVVSMYVFPARFFVKRGGGIFDTSIITKPRSSRVAAPEHSAKEGREENAFVSLCKSYVLSGMQPT